jgi:hypothetical protein
MKLPQFTIRELFLVTLIVALCLGWFLDHGWLTFERDQYRRYWSIGGERQSELREALRKAEAEIAKAKSMRPATQNSILGPLTHEQRDLLIGKDNRPPVNP